MSFCCVLLVFFPGSPESAPRSLLPHSSKISACLLLTRLSCVPGLGDAWLSEEVLLQRRKNQLEGQLRISPHEFLALAGCRSRSGALLTYYSSSSMLACGAHVEDQEALSRKPRHFPVFSSTILRPSSVERSPVRLDDCAFEGQSLLSSLCGGFGGEAFSPAEGLPVLLSASPGGTSLASGKGGGAGFPFGRGRRSEGGGLPKPGRTDLVLVEMDHLLLLRDHPSLFSETSSIFALDNIKNEIILRDFFIFRS